MAESKKSIAHERREVTYLDPSVHKFVVEIALRTGESKSKIISDAVREFKNKTESKKSF